MLRFLTFSAAVALLAATGRAEAPKTLDLFNGKDLSGWKPKGDEAKSKWQVCAVTVNPRNTNEFIAGIDNSPDGKGAVLANVAGGSVDLISEKKFGSCTIEVEFSIPRGSNSGVYVMGEYEVQILDSFGKEKVGPGDLGGIYRTAAPKVNASKKAGEWQKFTIEFQAPKFDGEKKVLNAKFIKVTLNDQLIHENVEMNGPTPGGLTGKEMAVGPLMFQGDHGPVAFRNIRVTPKAE